jgi:dTDP-glucose 4,6-dehydratase
MTQDINNLAVAEMILKHMNLTDNRIEFVKDRLGHDRRYAVDWTKINTDLNWEPEHNFDSWLKATVDWYQQNEDWWRPLKEEAEATYQKSGQ